jgi:hypothetical protein
MDESDADDRIRECEWLDDLVPPRAIEQPVESVERSTEGHVISRFPVSFARTRLPHVSANGSRTSGSIGNSKHCRHCTCDLNAPSNPAAAAAAAHFNSITSKTAKHSHGEAMVYRRLSYRVKEFVFLATC